MIRSAGVLLCLYAVARLAAQTTSGTAPYHDYGPFQGESSNTFMRINVLTMAGKSLLTSTSNPAIPVLTGSVELGLTFDDCCFIHLSGPLAGSLTVEYFIDSDAIGQADAKANLVYDTTAVADGTHVFNARVVNGNAASPYAANQVRSGGLAVVIANHSANVGAQTIAVTGMDVRSVHYPSTPDFVRYPGMQVTNTPHPYNSPFIAPNTSTPRDPKKFFIEPLTETRHTLYKSSPHFYTIECQQKFDTLCPVTAGDEGISVQGFVAEKNDTIEASLPAVVHQAPIDGERDNGQMEPYATFVPTPDGSGFTGVDLTGRIFTLDWDGAITTIAGAKWRTNPPIYDYLDLNANYDATRTMVCTGCQELNGPTDLAYDPRNLKRLYVADTLNHRILSIDLSTNPPTFTNYAGVYQSKGYLDGPAQLAKFNEPYSITMTPNGTMFVADMFNSSIRKISPDGSTVSTLIGGVIYTETFCAASQNNCSDAGSVAIASAKTGFPQVIRTDSKGNLVYGEVISRTVRLVDFATGQVTRPIAFNCCTVSHSWIWLDVDTAGTVGQKDDIFFLFSQGGAGNVNLYKYSEDGTQSANFVTSGVLADGWPPYTVDSPGHYTWAVTVARTQCRFATTGFGTEGISSWRCLSPTDNITAPDNTKYAHGYREWASGSIDNRTWWPWEARPSFAAIAGDVGTGHLGLPTFDDVIVTYPTDSALAAYIQSGYGGTVKRPELTGCDLRDLIYFIRRTVSNSVVPGTCSADKTPPVISNVIATRDSATTGHITWATDKSSLGYAAWGTSSTQYYGWSSIENQEGTSHTVSLSNLPSGVTIHASVISKDDTGNLSSSADISF